MNKLIKILDKLKICISLLFFLLVIVVGNAQDSSSDNAIVQDSILPLNQVLDTIPNANKVSDSIPKTNQNLDTIFDVNKDMFATPKDEISNDSINLINQASDSIPKTNQNLDTIFPANKDMFTTPKNEKTQEVSGLWILENSPTGIFLIVFSSAGKALVKIRGWKSGFQMKIIFRLPLFLI